MAIALVQSAEFGEGGSGALSVTLGSNLTIGNVVKVFAMWKGAALTVSSVNGGGTYSNDAAIFQDSFGDNSASQCFTAVVTTATESVSITLSSTPTFGYIHVSEWSGVNTTTPIDVIAAAKAYENQSSGANAFAGNAVVTATANAVVIGYAACIFSGTISSWSIGTAFTAIGPDPSTYGQGHAEYEVAATTGSYTPTFTANGATGTTDGVVWGLALKPTGAPAGVPIAWLT